VLKFYASGLRDAADVQVRIDGEEAPVLYAGKSAYLDALDEVNVLVPRSLAGRGNVEVVLTVDGQPASPVRVQIQ
jgi:uncharacterized protein (TIGR03437 family)